MSASDEASEALRGESWPLSRALGKVVYVRRTANRCLAETVAQRISVGTRVGTRRAFPAFLAHLTGETSESG